VTDSAQAATAVGATSQIVDRMDEIIEALEARVLAEIERRGGRFSGEF
jgi:hypothetical protein